MSQPRAWWVLDLASPVSLYNAQLYTCRCQCIATLHHLEASLTPFFPIYIVQNSLALFVQLIQTRELLQEVRFIEGS